jgi:hypothetical protein
VPKDVSAPSEIHEQSTYSIDRCHINLNNTAGMSHSPPKQSKRPKRFLNRLQGVFQRKSRPPSPSRSTPDLPAGDNSLSPRPCPSPNQPNITPPPAQIRGSTGESNLSSMSNPGPALSAATAASLASPAAPTTTTKKLGEIWGVAWSGLETALRVLEKSADAFPPLKSAVSGLVACLDVIQVSCDSRFTKGDHV